MITANNPLGDDPMDINDSTSAERVGERIREIRMSQGMSQVELGEQVGITGARVYKYEIGERKAKTDLLRQMAEALGVETMALTDPVVENHLGAMYAFFAMEKKYGMKICCIDDQLVLTVDDETLKEHLALWEKELSQTNAALETAKSEEERKEILHAYDMWKWTYPRGTGTKELRRKKLEEQKRQLEEELAKLDNE